MFLNVLPDTLEFKLWLSRVFHPKFFWQFFSWNQSCQQLKSPKPQHFHKFFTQKIDILGQKMKISNSVPELISCLDLLGIWVTLILHFLSQSNSLFHFVLKIQFIFRTKAQQLGTDTIFANLSTIVHTISRVRILSDKNWILVKCWFLFKVDIMHP